MGKFKVSLVIILFCFVSTQSVPERSLSPEQIIIDDSIIIEATPWSRKSINKRDTQTNLHLQPAFIHTFVLNETGAADNVLSTLGTCLSNKGVVGRCTPFRQCYPYFKLPELGNWDTWILGMYDTCSYFTSQGRQKFGVCCTNPGSTNEVNNSDKIEENDKNKQEGTESENENKLVPIYANWPPPIPTHPPDHTIPPLPTHPPSPGYPIATHPSATTTKPVTTVSYPWPTAPTTSAPASQLPVTSCGTKNGYQDQERIVGGHNADLGEWPWIAALFNGGRQFCGGSLIDNIHILSAAHCVAHMSSWDVARLTVRLGDYNIRTNSEVQHIEKKVKRIVRHRGFDSRTLYNDVSIITMDSPVQFTQQIRPICLPSGSANYASKTATVIGWGSLQESGTQPSVLQEVNIPIWSNAECRAKYGNAAPGGIVEHMLCAGRANRDSCSGDSGGPLMVNNGVWTQVGIVSWGIGCGKGQYPGVYTRVTHFLPWITKNLK
ncbi:lethal (2) k05911 [Carabus blaptoides fortunei]